MREFRRKSTWGRKRIDTIASPIGTIILLLNCRRFVVTFAFKITMRATLLTVSQTARPRLCSPPALLVHTGLSTLFPCRFGALAQFPCCVRPFAVTTKQKGDALEIQVERILRREGRWRVRRNVELRDSHGNRSQIDVMYGLFRRRYVECKNYSSEHKVPLDDVAKFKEVLRLNGISPSRGLFVTTSGFTPRALTTGISTIDGDQLKAWEKASRRGAAFRRFWSFVLWFLAPAASIILLVAPYWLDLRLPGSDHPAMSDLLRVRSSTIAVWDKICEVVAAQGWQGLTGLFHSWWVRLTSAPAAGPAGTQSEESRKRESIP